MSTESPISLAAVHTMRALARAFGHGWACDPLGPTDEEVLSGDMLPWHRRLVADDAAEQARLIAVAAEDPIRLGWLENNPEMSRQEWRGLAPVPLHESGSGTVTWTVDPRTGAAVVVFQRAIGPATIAGYGGPYRQRVEVVQIEGGHLRVSPDPSHWTSTDEARSAEHVWSCVQRACVALGMTRPADGAWPQRPPRKPLPGADMPPVRRL